MIKSLRQIGIAFTFTATIFLFALTSVAQNKQKAASRPTPAPTSGPLVFDKKAPTHITSDELTVHNEERVFVYSGNVTVDQGDLKITSKTLEGTYSEQNEIQKLVAKGDVLILKGDIRANSQQALYDAATDTLTLIDNPQVQQGDSILAADKIKIYLKDNRSQAEGQVRVTFVNKSQTPTPRPAAGLGATPTPH